MNTGEKRLATIVFALLLVTVGLLFYVRSERQKVERIQRMSALIKDQNAPHITAKFLDVGQGDATYISFPDGTDMLIDCAKDARVLGALGRVMKTLDRTIDYLIVTHPDNDHYGGCIDVMNRFTIKHIIYTGLRKDQEPYWRYFWDTIQKEGAVYEQVEKNETWNIASSTIIFLYPDHDVTIDPAIPSSTEKAIDNNTSIVMKIIFGRSSILLTGDMEAPLEKYLVEKNRDILQSDILKVGHHGSPGASSQLFLDAVQPEYATISVGKDNTYGHPSLRVIRRLERVGANVWRTDKNRDISFRLYKEGILEDNIGI